MAITPQGGLSEALNRAPLSAFQIRVIVICFIIALLDGFDTQSIAFIAPALKTLWSLPPEQTGLLFGSSLFGTMLGATGLGLLADTIGRKTTIIISMVVFGVMSLLCATATSVDQLLLYRFITGIGLGGAIPNIIALTSEYSPGRMRTTAVTVMFCGFPLGAVLGGIASTQIMAAHGWHAVFFVGGVLPLLMLPVVFGWLPESIQHLANRGNRPEKAAEILKKIDPSIDPGVLEDRGPEQKPSSGSRVGALFTEGRAPWTLLLWTVISLSLLLTYFLVNWIPSTLADAGLSHKQAVMGTVVLNIGGILGSVLVGRLCDRYGLFLPLIAGYALGALAIVAIGVSAGKVSQAMMMIFLAGFFTMGAQLALASLSAHYYPSHMRSTGVGWGMGMGRIGSFLGPVIGGALLAAGFSQMMLFLAAAVPALVVAAALYAMSRNIPPQGGEKG